MTDRPPTPIRRRIKRVVVVHSDIDYLTIPAVKSIAWRLLVAGIVIGIPIGCLLAYLFT